MRKINFTKMVAAGNDFVVLECLSAGVLECSRLAMEVCDRKFGAGADGLLVLEKSKIADIKMRIFNADGSEAEMCGNGARCVGLYWSHVARRTSHVNIETKAGVIDAKVEGNNVKIRLTDPKNIKLDIPIKINNRTLRVNFINTGVPHTVVFVEGLDGIDVFNLGRQIRYHRKFKPVGTNVDFVEVLSDDSLRIRTYERGVEDETLACGTGTVAAAIISAMALGRWGTGSLGHWVAGAHKINVYTKSGEILKVSFNNNKRIENVWLEGEARIVYKGVYNV